MDKFKIRNFKIEKLKWPTYFFLKITFQSISKDDIMKLQQYRKVLYYREDDNLWLAKKNAENLLRLLLATSLYIHPVSLFAT